MWKSEGKFVDLFSFSTFSCIPGIKLESLALYKYISPGLFSWSSDFHPYSFDNTTAQSTLKSGSLSAPPLIVLMFKIIPTLLAYMPCHTPSRNGVPVLQNAMWRVYQVPTIPLRLPAYLFTS